MLPTDLGLVLHSRISTAPTTRDAAFVAQCAAITSRKGGGGGGCVSVFADAASGRLNQGAEAGDYARERTETGRYA